MRPPHTWAVQDLTTSSNGQMAAAQTLGAVAFDNISRPEWARDQVFSIDKVGHVQAMTRQPDASWKALDLTVYAGAPPIGKTTRLVATAAPGNNADYMGSLAVFVDDNRHLYSFLSPAAGGWSYGDLTAITSAAPVRDNLVCAHHTTYICSEQVLFVDDNNHVCSINRVKAGRWSLVDLTARTKAPPMDGTAISGASCEFGTEQSVS